jgi:septum formation protein
MPIAERQPLVLASTSRYRRALLERLRLPFECVAPGVDETALAGETPRGQAGRLARLKAEAVAAQRPGAIVIGSDQVAELAGRALGKPGGRSAALAQLQACSGREVAFHTAVCVLGGPQPYALLDRTTVRFRALRGDEIERYLDAEQPFDCAGSFKVEGLGACLFEAVLNEDPTALVGLPLVQLAGVLRDCGYALP